MGRHAHDLSGLRFGRWTVVERTGSLGKGSAWRCVCDCGEERIVRASGLLGESSQSCGCLRRELATLQEITHGMSYSRPYRIWRSMIERCHNPSHIYYSNYGGRGISVCDRWRRFENFWMDMSDLYRDGLCIDRIDNNGDYEPGNCRWVTNEEQQRNRNNNKLLEFRGETKCLVEWSDIVGIERTTISERLRRGWSIARSLTEPVRSYRVGGVN